MTIDDTYAPMGMSTRPKPPPPYSGAAPSPPVTRRAAARVIRTIASQGDAPTLSAQRSTRAAPRMVPGRPSASNSCTSTAIPWPAGAIGTRSVRAAAPGAQVGDLAHHIAVAQPLAPVFSRFNRLAAQQFVVDQQHAGLTTGITVGNGTMRNGDVQRTILGFHTNVQAARGCHLPACGHRFADRARPVAGYLPAAIDDHLRSVDAVRGQGLHYTGVDARC